MKLKAQVPGGTIQSINPRVMWLEHRKWRRDRYSLAIKRIGKVLSSGGSPLVKMYSCVEFGRLGCTRFIFIKEVPCFTMTFWLKSLDPKVAFLLSHPSHPGYRASGGVPWYSIRVAPSVLGFVLSYSVCDPEQSQCD